MFKIKLGGIYIIEIGEYYYIGCSVDVFSRWNSHYTSLKMKTHSSKKLQTIFNENRIEDVTFRVLEYISITDFKSISQLKGKDLDRQYRRYLLLKEREHMGKYSINFSLNQDNKYFSK